MIVLAMRTGERRFLGSRLGQGPSEYWVFLDKGAHLATQGLRVLGDRLDPDVRDDASNILHQYTNTRVKMKNVQDNLQRVGRAVKDAGFEY